MTEALIAGKSSRYHLDRECAGFKQGRRNSEALGRQLHEPEVVSVEEAQRRGLKPCKRCSGGS